MKRMEQTASFFRRPLDLILFPEIKNFELIKAKVN